MTSNNIKLVYMMGLLVWAIGLGAIPVLTANHIVTGPVALSIAGVFAVLYIGSFMYLNIKGYVAPGNSDEPKK